MYGRRPFEHRKRRKSREELRKFKSRPDERMAAMPIARVGSYEIHKTNLSYDDSKRILMTRARSPIGTELFDQVYTRGPYGREHHSLRTGYPLENESVLQLSRSINNAFEYLIVLKRTAFNQYKPFTERVYNGVKRGIFFLYLFYRIFPPPYAVKQQH